MSDIYIEVVDEGSDIYIDIVNDRVIVRDTDMIKLINPEYYDIPTGYTLKEMLIHPSEPITFRLGTTANGEELIEDFDIDEDGKMLIPNIFAKNSKRVYFGGLTAEETLIALVIKKFI